jgi:hypothetical protein
MFLFLNNKRVDSVDALRNLFAVSNDKEELFYELLKKGNKSTLTKWALNNYYGDEDIPEEGFYEWLSGYTPKNLNIAETTAAIENSAFSHSSMRVIETMPWYKDFELASDFDWNNTAINNKEIDAIFERIREEAYEAPGNLYKTRRINLCNTGETFKADIKAIGSVEFIGYGKPKLEIESTYKETFNLAALDVKFQGITIISTNECFIITDDTYMRDCELVGNVKKKEILNPEQKKELYKSKKYRDDDFETDNWDLVATNDDELQWIYGIIDNERRKNPTAETAFYTIHLLAIHNERSVACFNISVENHPNISYQGHATRFHHRTEVMIEMDLTNQVYYTIDLVKYNVSFSNLSFIDRASLLINEYSINCCNFHENFEFKYSDGVNIKLVKLKIYQNGDMFSEIPNDIDWDYTALNNEDLQAIIEGIRKEASENPESLYNTRKINLFNTEETFKADIKTIGSVEFIGYCQPKLEIEAIPYGHYPNAPIDELNLAALDMKFRGVTIQSTNECFIITDDTYMWDCELGEKIKIKRVKSDEEKKVYLEKLIGFAYCTRDCIYITTPFELEWAYALIKKDRRNKTDYERKHIEFLKTNMGRYKVSIEEFPNIYYTNVWQKGINQNADVELTILPKSTERTIDLKFYQVSFYGLNLFAEDITLFINKEIIDEACGFDNCNCYGIKFKSSFCSNSRLIQFMLQAGEEILDRIPIKDMEYFATNNEELDAILNPIENYVLGGEYYPTTELEYSVDCHNKTVYLFDVGVTFQLYKEDIINGNNKFVGIGWKKPKVVLRTTRNEDYYYRKEIVTGKKIIEKFKTDVYSYFSHVAIASDYDGRIYKEID